DALPIDVGFGLQQVGGHVQALGAVEVRRLLGDDGDVGELLDALGEALAAVAGGGGAGHALQHDHLALLADRGGESLGGLGAAGDIVRGDEAGELAGGGVAVHSDDGDVRIVERLDGGGDGVGVGGVDDHQGVALGDGVGELVGLGGGVVGGVLHVEAD